VLYPAELRGLALVFNVSAAITPGSHGQNGITARKWGKDRANSAGFRSAQPRALPDPPAPLLHRIEQRLHRDPWQSSQQTPAARAEYPRRRPLPAQLAHQAVDVGEPVDQP